MQGQTDVPNVNEVHSCQAVTLIPSNYWNLNCCTCSLEDHSTFSCPDIPAQQRLYFFYSNYLYQVQANPRMVK